MYKKIDFTERVRFKVLKVKYQMVNTFLRKAQDGYPEQAEEWNQDEPLARAVRVNMPTPQPQGSISTCRTVKFGL
jgi:hypothetical protein